MWHSKALAIFLALALVGTTGTMGLLEKYQLKLLAGYFVSAKLQLTEP